LAKRPTVDAEEGETEVHEAGAAAQQIADLGTAAMLIAVEPPDLIVVDVAAASLVRVPVQTRTSSPEPGRTKGM
jgi:hypothetical protein